MRFPIRIKLLAAFAVNLALMLLLGIVATQQMALMNNTASLVATHTIPSLDTVAALKEQVNAYRVNQLELMLYTSSADQARSIQRMGEVERAVTGYLVTYRPLITSDEEREQYLAVSMAWQRLVVANRSSFIPDATRNNTGAVRPFYSRMNPYYRDVETAIAGLTVESQKQAAASLNVVQSAYQNARSFIVGDTLLALVISAALGLVFASRLAARIGRLTSAADRVASGDLSPTVAIQSRDELGRLAQSFNQMVGALRSQRVALEERNTALQSSLIRQEQLTADLIRGRQAEEEADRGRAAAEAASQAKSMFLATMSHELRTPLNAILGYAQLMRLTALTRPAALEVDPLDRILASGRHLTTMINNVLDFAKIEQGCVELSLSKVAVCTLVQESADVVAPLIERAGNRLELNCAGELGVMITDAGRVRQILINLLGNASKFTQNGMITLKAERDETGNDPTIVFEVHDTGIGIAPEHLARLFQPFSQVDPSVTRRYQGTGLGLALSKQLCTVLGGSINVASEPGKGSVFIVRLPVYPADSVSSAAPLGVVATA